MSSIPPKQTPDTAAFDEPESGGGMIAMYNAASHAGSESFPVLKAFQDYIEAERTQARKRMIQLSVSFVALMVVVVVGFLTAGVFMFRNMSSMQNNMSAMQNKLLDVALANKTAPAPQAAAPVLEDSVKQITRATTELQSSLDKKLDGVSEIASKVNDKVSSQDSELSKMRDELRQMQEQSAKLKDELVSVKASRQPVISYTAPPPRPTPVAVPAAQTPPPVPAAETAVSANPAPAPAVANAPTVAVAPTAAAAKSVATKAEPADSRFPPATKEPPAATPGVVAPAAPKGMVATAVPVATKNVGTIPWRVLIPE